MLVFGSDPNSFGQPQKSFVVVDSSTCTSRPITASYSGIAQDSSTMTELHGDLIDVDLCTTERVDLGNGVTIAYVDEGAGGAPLLLVHGYPETKRIWWRNMMPLAEAGFEVIAPDLRGHGESSLAPDGFYDIAAFSTDLYTLVHDVLGHEHCFVAGGDVGGPVVYDLSLRYPGFVKKLCYFNTVTPVLPAEYEAAGIPPDAPNELRSTADYFMRQANDPEGLLAELDTPERRRAYVAEMYGHRLWAGRGAFTPEDIDFMTEPYADADKLRASWGVYESSTGNRPMSDAAALPRDEPGAGAGALRPRGPRGPAVVRRPVQGGLHGVHRPVRGRGRPATSCNGKRRTSSTGPWRTSSSSAAATPVTARALRSRGRPGTCRLRRAPARAPAPRPAGPRHPSRTGR